MIISASRRTDIPAFFGKNLFKLKSKKFINIYIVMQINKKGINI